MEEFREKLIETINMAKLPVGEIFYIVKDVYRDLAEEYQRYLSAKRETIVNEQKKEDEQ